MYDGIPPQFPVLGSGRRHIVTPAKRCFERSSQFLAGALEAVVGAVYRAQGFRAARALTRRILKPELERTRRHGALVDAKSSLQHMVQARWHEPPEYVTVEDAAGSPARRFAVEVRIAGEALGRGEGRSKREAQQQAAQEAVAWLTAQKRGEG